MMRHAALYYRQRSFDFVKRLVRHLLTLPLSTSFFFPLSSTFLLRVGGISYFKTHTYMYVCFVLSPCRQAVDILHRLGDDHPGPTRFKFLNHLVSGPSPLSPPFRLFARILAAFAAQQLLGPKVVRVPGDPFSQDPSGLAKKEMKALLDTNVKESKHYKQYADLLTQCHSYINDPSKCLYTSSELISILVARLFPRKPLIRILAP